MNGTVLPVLKGKKKAPPQKTVCSWVSYLQLMKLEILHLSILILCLWLRDAVPLKEYRRKKKEVAEGKNVHAPDMG